MTKSTKWFLGILGVFALVFFGVALLFYLFLRLPIERTEVVSGGAGDKIAVVELEGVITASEDFVRQVKKYRKDRSIKGILLRINSPGGATVPSQEMYEEVRKTREAGKPIVVSMGSIAASGGYYVSCGSSRIVANRGTLTGSIGVVGEFLQVENALSKLGISVKTIKTGRLKDTGSPTRNMTDEDRRYLQSLLDDVHQQFVQVVETERKLPHERVAGFADGRAFTGIQALSMGLVDTLGTYEDALRITADLAGIAGEPTVVRERRRESVWDFVFGDAAQSVSDVKQWLLEYPVLSYRFVGPLQ
jgi:protease-4